MTTPIIMLILMITPALGVRVFSAVARSDYDLRGPAAVGLGVLFLFTGVGHFVKTEPMAQMLPAWVPARVPLVYLTGLMEFVIGIGFFVPRARRITGWVAMAALVLFFPANVYAAFNQVQMGGHAWGPLYLLVRAPLQVLILCWIYWFTIRRPAGTLS